MDYLKRFPKMAYASLALLVAAVTFMWADWVTLAGTGAFVEFFSNIKGGISFAGGYSVAKEVADLCKRANELFGGLLGGSAKAAVTLVSMLSIAYVVLFIGTIAAVGYCIYARLKWKEGLREGIYFLFFAGDVGMMFVLTSVLNKIAGITAFKMGIWGFVALGCALLSEVLWEEASFNTPKPGTEAWDKRQELLRK